MKTKSDPRHQKRVHLMQALFAWDFHQVEIPEEIAEIVSKVEEIDQLIVDSAPERPLQDINKTDLAILRLMIYEFSKHSTPERVIADEAVELAKEFSSESSAAFVNGVIGNIIDHKYI